ncbi:menaquinone-specific isochorismate synthase [Microbacterium terrae]|uniref:isochorismate synthase n=1 Tax=Microbacterium terrae TaxID=69369 RepID=UPI0005ED195C|nr:isochorismate synthase [Microbacterium terrae]MBP1076298.1 menaquinone-specific isochorismate synthase [Microbacterium terrae]
MSAAPRHPRLVVETREIDPVDDLISFTDPNTPLAWLRRGDGIVGLGHQVTGIEFGGAHPLPEADPFPSLAEMWRSLCETAEVDDEVGLPGTGLVAFGALAFDRRSAASSRLIVPQTVIGRGRGRSWVTRIRSSAYDGPDPAIATVPYGPYWSATLGPGTLDPEGYQAAVRQGIAAIESGEVQKVVLARDLVGTIPAGSDIRRLARALSTEYPDTWTFAVDGLVGASPETLVTVSHGTVTARVLAGTVPRGADSDGDATASFSLAHSAKDRDEHRFAVQSVLDALAPHVGAVTADAEPFTLELPNLWHLATDVEAELADHATSLDLVAALHPTAAVAGTPTDAAIEAIRRIEPFDRRRYAGPVGWVGADGDGEWAIALRCAQIGADPTRGYAEFSDTIPVVAHAGAGIMAESDPESELLETRVKFRPIVDALA